MKGAKAREVNHPTAGEKMTVGRWTAYLNSAMRSERTRSLSWEECGKRDVRKEVNNVPVPLVSRRIKGR